MLAIQVKKTGGPEVLGVVELKKPAPGPGQALIRVEAIGVNYADCIVRMGLYASAKEYVGWPITPGFEVAGKVAAVGAGVADLAEGAAVLAVTRFGGYATHVTAAREHVRPVPAGLSIPEAAGTGCGQRRKACIGERPSAIATTSERPG